MCKSSEIECENEILADIQLANLQQLQTLIPVSSDSVIIDDDADNVIAYDDNDENDNITCSSHMQLVTEKLLKDVKVLPLPFLSKLSRSCHCRLDTRRYI